MKISLIKAKKQDSKFFYSLRNESANRKNFKNSNFINEKDHRKWFIYAIKDVANNLYKIKIKKKYCGYVRALKKNKILYISICIDKKFRKKNLASEALLLIENKFQKKETFVAIVKKKNLASKHLFLGVGYNIFRKRKNLLFMKKNNSAIKIIDQIESIRSKNNINWMNLLRLAYKKSPRESALIMSKIYRDDSKISKLVKKLINR